MEIITIEGNQTVEISRTGNEFLLNQQRVASQTVTHTSDRYTVEIGGRSIEVLVLAFDGETKDLTLRVNGKKTTLKITPQSEIYLKKIGIEASALQKVSHLKAPMPGLIKRVDVQVGQSVSAGDSLLVLEAMKMENVLKASAAGVVKSINVTARQAVEKNTVLIAFE